ncbi:MAG: hypothetical protein EWV76_03710 [Microcystis novacekii Mn_MB_F_20050700_S1]|uniref:Uncharacterized protein n=1 Tax=Microcystis novacekii Mn_MB_F_20050700_S1D TaxID=2486266 RepID=A0A552ICJ6_9CHRO|nr:MAG: hypothetical protein EWV54_24425 [Microcystis novacekii Mn_MB_F_20050700_S1D]TRU91510.1 MAG: hypothetical protein EWV76_03710 [Microcystis novacekii Mn_MB_F_20050700_S1]
MAFYAFRLDRINVITPRSNHLDDDVVTFGVLVNQVDIGHGTATFPSLSSGSMTLLPEVPPRNRKNINQRWECGPYEFSSGDLIHVFYSGFNIADDHNITLDTQKQDQIELKILNAILTGAVGAIGGLIGAAIGAVLGAITDPIGSLLGYQPPVRCNGLVFSDAVEFSGAGLDSLVMTVTSGDYRPRITFTKRYTDETTHNDQCGEIAKTEIVFSIIKVSSISIRALLLSRFLNVSPKNGLRHLASTASTFSVKSLLGVRSP